MNSILIVGAGLSGCTLARQFAEKDYSVKIIEKRDHIGGNCYDYHDKNGILINKYGPHYFHTNNKRVQSFVEKYAEWVPFKNRVLGKIDSNYFPIPVNITTVNTLCKESIQNEEEMKAWLAKNTVSCETPKNSEDVALKRVGPVLYDKIFKHYTYKQWDKYPVELNPSVLERIPVRTNDDPYYFSDTFQAVPKKGYTDFIQSMIQHPNITVALNTDYTPDMASSYTYVFYTGPIDHYFSKHGYPKLEYRSIQFEIEHLDVEHFQPTAQVNYPSNDVSFTRITEYKHVLNQYAPGKTTIVREYSTSDGEPYYPVPTKKNQDLYLQYQELAKKEESNGIYFVGRLAKYKYFNMDEAILSALELSDTLLNMKTT